MNMAACKTRRKNSLSIYDARVAGLYDLEETIGKGHFAVVKLARHVFTGEKVAVKIIDKMKLDKVSQQHIMQEVRCMKLVQHPSIVRLYEVIDTQSKLFLILELADYDMYDYLQRFPSGIPETDAQRYFAQIVDAIHYCHELHVVHRDLKPENVVFFEKLGMVKLTDFGFSNVYSPGTLLDTSCGSLAYSAPEILLGDAYDAPAVDVWSLGVILYMFVTGRLPFQEANDSETLTKILDCKYPIPDELSEECRNLIKQMLVREPTTRSSLSDIRQHEWVCGGRTEHATMLPLVGRQQLSDDDHDTIVAQMVHGGIAPPEQVHSALDRDDYSHVTATYYLLAERVLRAEREARARALMAETMAKSNPELASIGHINDVDMIEEDADSSECEQSGSTNGVPGGSGTSAFVPLPTLAEDSAVDATNGSTSGQNWRQRSFSFSMLKEESEEELAALVSSRRSSRAGSPNTSAFRASSERVSPAAILDLLDISGRLSSGRRSPDSRTQSRSPSPPHATPNANLGVTTGIISRLSNKPVTTPQMRKLSSSPHLIGICEEAEDAEHHEHTSGECALCATTGGAAAATAKRSIGSLGMSYGSVRMIRPRQAVVNQDVIRRYDRGTANNSVNRSRRSTSCSSSEASDDEGRQLAALGAGLARHCRGRRRGGSDGGGDDDGGASGTAGGPQQPHSSSQSGASNPGGGGDTTGHNGTAAGGSHSESQAAELDTSRLMGQLRKLALAPIDEYPVSLPRFLRRPMSVASGGGLFEPNSSVLAALSIARSHCVRSPVVRSNSTCQPLSEWLHRLRRAKSAEHIRVVSSTADQGDNETYARGDAPRVVHFAHTASISTPQQQHLTFDHLTKQQQHRQQQQQQQQLHINDNNTDSQSDSAFSTQSSRTSSLSNYESGSSPVDSHDYSDSSDTSDDHNCCTHLATLQLQQQQHTPINSNNHISNNNIVNNNNNNNVVNNNDNPDRRRRRRRRRRAQLLGHEHNHSVNAIGEDLQLVAIVT